LVSHWKPRTPAALGCSPGTPSEDINANYFIKPRRFSCKRKRHRSCCLQLRLRYDDGKTFGFTLDSAMAIIVEDNKAEEIAINTWFMPHY
jgi:hypothetical protein